MTMRTNGGPAFPGEAPSGETDYEGSIPPRVFFTGMSLRDYFAGQALVGFLSAPADMVSCDAGPNARANPTRAAEWAYQQADAMLTERAK